MLYKLFINKFEFGGDNHMVDNRLIISYVHLMCHVIISNYKCVTS